MVVDWKSNTNFKRVYDSNQKTAYEPIQHLPNNKMSKYQLQLSMYAYMLEQDGAEIDSLLIVEIREDKIIEYNVEYLKEEVKEMIKYDKESNTKGSGEVSPKSI